MKLWWHLEQADIDACEADCHRIEEPEQQAGKHHRHRPPLGEDQRRQRDEALAGGHVLHKARVLGDCEIGASKAAQDTAADDRPITQPGDRNAGRVDRAWIFADSAQPKAKARAEQDPPGERDREKGQIDEDRMAGDQLRIDGAEDRHIRNSLGKRQINGREAAPLGTQGRRATALAEPGLAENDRRAGGDEVDRNARDDLVAAMGDRGKAMHQRQRHRDDDRKEQADPGRSVDGSGSRAGKGGGQHLALKADVEDAGSLGVQARQCGKHQRDRQAHR